MECCGQKKIAIIGFGNRGLAYVKGFRESLGEKIAITAVVDPDLPGVSGRLKRLNLQTDIYSTVQEMLSKQKHLDGLIISSPDNCHLESFQAVAHLDKPILFEKPLEGNRDKFYKLVDGFRQYQGQISVGHCMRHAPILRKAKELIDRGWIGRVTSMRFVQNCHYGDVFFRGWHRRKESITSLFLEKATHDFDIMHMMNNNNFAESVFAFSKRYKYGGNKPDDLHCTDCPDEVECPESLLNLCRAVRGESGAQAEERVGRDKCVWAKEIEIDDDQMCLIEFSNGVQGCYIQTFYTPANYRGRVYTIVGTEGVLDIDMGEFHGQIKFFPGYGTKKDKMVYEFDYLGRNHYNGDFYLVRNFLGLMQGKEKPLTTIPEAIVAELTGLAAVKSVETRKLERIDSDILDA